MAESLKGKVAVISGVGSGFGKATAELFARAAELACCGQALDLGRIYGETGV